MQDDYAPVPKLYQFMVCSPLGFSEGTQTVHLIWAGLKENDGRNRTSPSHKVKLSRRQVAPMEFANGGWRKLASRFIPETGARSITADKPAFRTDDSFQGATDRGLSGDRCRIQEVLSTNAAAELVTECLPEWLG